MTNLSDVMTELSDWPEVNSGKWEGGGLNFFRAHYLFTLHLHNLGGREGDTGGHLFFFVRPHLRTSTAPFATHPGRRASARTEVWQSELWQHK